MKSSVMFCFSKGHLGHYRHLFLFSLGISALMILSTLFANNPQRYLANFSEKNM